KGFVVTLEEAMDNEPDYLSRSEVLPCGLIRGFRKLSDELFECLTHHPVRHPIRMQVDGRELLNEQIKQVLVVQLDHTVDELEMFEDVARVLREIPDVGNQVLANVCGIAEKHRNSEAAGVVERQSTLTLQEHVYVDARVLALFPL